MDPTVTAAAIGVGGTVIVGVAGFWASVRNTSKTTALTLRAVELTEQGQVTDRYTRAIGQLGSGKLDVRIGAIYALERIARDSPRDHPAVMDVLSAFIREHSREPWPADDPEPVDPSTRPDIQAAVTVLVRRDWSNDREPIDLTGARLPRADLSHGHFRNADLTDADLTGADLADADLSGAALWGAELQGARLMGANLTNATLIGANLTVAILDNTEFSGADLTDASFSERETPPDGWVRDAQSGELRRANG
jgi:Pentapeptide repeats (8 copies)